MKLCKKTILILSLFLLFGVMDSMVRAEGESLNDESWQSQKPGTYRDESWKMKEIPCEKCYIKPVSPQVTAVGEKIYIRGNGFGEKTGEVIFNNNVPAKIISWQNGRIWVLVPEGAVTGDVKVIKTCPSGKFEVPFYLKIENQLLNRP